MSEYNSEPYKSVFDSKFYVPAGSLSATTGIQTANQLAEVNARLNAGVYGVDLALINADIANQIPRQHFAEIRRLAKLSNANVSMHGPIQDLAGAGQKGYGESERRQVVYQMNDVIEKAHELNPEGNTPVNFHINTGVPGENKRKLNQDEINALSPEERVYLKNGSEFIESIGIVNQETGDFVGVAKHDVRYRPDGSKDVFTPEMKIDMQNLGHWDEEKQRVFAMQKTKAELNMMINNEASREDYKQLRIGDQLGNLHPEQQAEFERMQTRINSIKQHIEIIDRDTDLAKRTMFHEIEKYSKVHERFKDNLEQSKREESLINGYLEEFRGNMPKIMREKDKIDEGEFRLNKEIQALQSSGQRLSEDQTNQFNKQIKQFNENREHLNHIELTFINNVPVPPSVLAPTNEYALGKTAQTVAEAALDAYKKFGKSTPIITLENYQQDFTLGTAADMERTILKSRQMFAEKLSQERNISERDAMKEAEKIIGVTWDVGHINFLRKKGYSEEDIVNETARVARFVKQVHITDNFGFTDSHLPPGMGKAPIAAQLDAMKKGGFNISKKGSLIVEAGEFVGHFKENPHMYTLEGFASPLYPLKAAPSWYQIRDVQGPYNMGIGNIYPELHFRDLYGTSFSTLPRELGGQFPGEKSRFAGTPNV